LTGLVTKTLKQSHSDGHTGASGDGLMAAVSAIAWQKDIDLTKTAPTATTPPSVSENNSFDANELTSNVNIYSPIRECADSLDDVNIRTIAAEISDTKTTVMDSQYVKSPGISGPITFVEQLHQLQFTNSEYKSPRDHFTSVTGVEQSHQLQFTNCEYKHPRDHFIPVGSQSEIANPQSSPPTSVATYFRSNKINPVVFTSASELDDSCTPTSPDSLTEGSSGSAMAPPSLLRDPVQPSRVKRRRYRGISRSRTDVGDARLPNYPLSNDSETNSEDKDSKTRLSVDFNKKMAVSRRIVPSNSKTGKMSDTMSTLPRAVRFYEDTSTPVDTSRDSSAVGRPIRSVSVPMQSSRLVRRTLSSKPSSRKPVK